MDVAIVPLNEERLPLFPTSHTPFPVIGRLVPKYDGMHWSVSEELLGTPLEKTYPDESFDPADYIGCPDRAAFLALVGEDCVGMVRLCRNWNQNALIEDLEIKPAFRRRGIGARLMDAAADWSRRQGLRGMMLETQDWNLMACRFYLRYGFVLGGLDSLLYAHSPYHKETALFFYLALEDGK